MKNFSRFLVAAFVLAVTTVFASTDIPVFKKSTAQENWDNTRSIWEREVGNGKGEMPIEHLYAIAKETVAKPSNHPSSHLSDLDFNAAMADRNGLPKSGMVSMELVRFKAQGDGIYLPNPPKVMAQAAPEASNRSLTSPVSAPQGVVPGVDPTDAGILKALELLNRKVSELEKRGGDTTQLSAQIAALKVALSKTVTNDQYQKLAKTVTTLSGDVTARLLMMEGKVAALTESVATMQGVIKEGTTQLARYEDRLTAIERTAGGVAPTTWAGVILALVAVLLAFAAYFRKQPKVGLSQAQLTVVREETSAMARNVNLRIGEALETAQGAKRAVDEMRRDTGHNRVAFDGDFDRVSAALKDGSKAERWLCCFEGTEEKYLLLFEAAEEGKVHVFGIKGQTNAVKLENLKTVIGRAAQPRSDTGHHRLVGVTADEIRAEEVVIFADTQPVIPPAAAVVESTVSSYLKVA